VKAANEGRVCRSSTAGGMFCDAIALLKDLKKNPAGLAYLIEITAVEPWQLSEAR